MAEGRIECVATRLRGAKKHLLLLGDDAWQAKVPADCIDTVEVLRRLHETDTWVAEKTDGALEKILCRNEICVEHRDQFAAASRQGGVHVARLRVAVVGPVAVVAAEFVRQRPHLRSALVVEQVNLLPRIAQRLAPEDCPTQHLDRFAVSWAERYPHPAGSGLR